VGAGFERGKHEARQGARHVLLGCPGRPGPAVGDVVGNAGERLTPGAAELTAGGDAGKAS
jgi:hypothetical protein